MGQARVGPVGWRHRRDRAARSAVAAVRITGAFGHGAADPMPLPSWSASGAPSMAHRREDWMLRQSSSWWLRAGLLAELEQQMQRLRRWRLLAHQWRRAGWLCRAVRIAEVSSITSPLRRRVDAQSAGRAAIPTSPRNSSPAPPCATDFGVGVEAAHRAADKPNLIKNTSEQGLARGKAARRDVRRQERVPVLGRCQVGRHHPVAVLRVPAFFDQPRSQAACAGFRERQ